MNADPKILERARKAAASVHPFSHNSALILDGQRDGTDIVCSAMAAIVATDSEAQQEITHLRLALADISNHLAVDFQQAEDALSAVRGKLYAKARTALKYRLPSVEEWEIVTSPAQSA